jgi:hypothetical protein
MLSEKRMVLHWIDRQWFPGEMVEFREAMFIASIHALGLSPIEAEAFAEASFQKFWNFLLEKIDCDSRRGVSCIFAILDSSSYRLRWIPHSLMRSSKRRERARGLKLVTRPVLLEAIDSLSAREYEALACVISTFAGATKTKLTPRRKEGGIDFLALIEQHGHCHLFSGATGPLRLIGQSKKYGNPLEAGEIRDFITTIDNVRKCHPDIERHIPGWFRSARGPVAGWVIAHQGFQVGAERLARDHGIVVSDSLDLAEIAALSRKLEICRTAQERADKLIVMVQDILRNP